MNIYLTHAILDQHFLLSAKRTIYWTEQKALILSDLHIGKSGHFRKNGIAIPPQIFLQDLDRLSEEIAFHQPIQIIIVGDLFHSHSNKEHDYFLEWRNLHPQISFHLVLGNHDIVDRAWYAQANIQLHEEALSMAPFAFVHDIEKLESLGGHYFISGHIHPAVNMKGLGKQSIKLPCFYFGEGYAVLPAFGKFTGTHLISPNNSDVVFGFTETHILQIQ
jgi:DNA ligase-associated metallophosphoesterase